MPLRPPPWLLVLCAALLFHTSAWADSVSPAPILQWFDASWQTMEKRTPDLFMAGYGTVWAPPPGRADSGNHSVGYDVYDRFDLGSRRDPTLYGTETGLKTLAESLHRAGKQLHIDFVINHNGFSDRDTPGFLQSGGYPGFYLTHPQAPDGDFHHKQATGVIQGRISGLIDIDHSTNWQAIRNPVPGFANNLPAGTTPHFGRLANVPNEANCRFYPDQSLDPIIVFDPKTGEQGIHIYPFNPADPMAGDPVPENAMGYLMRNVQWLVQVIGVDGFRIDAAKHVEPWALDYFDRAVYRSNPRTLLDGSQAHVFSYSEVYDGNRSLLQGLIRQDINHADPGRVGGNRDVLDFPQFFAMRDNLTANGLQNDWRNVARAGMDWHDNGRIDGSAGVLFVQSHDDFGPYLNNVAHAFTLMRPGNAVVYHDAKQFGNRDFPKDGRGDALGGLYGEQITTLLGIRESHGRGDYIERHLSKELLAFEREGSALVLLNNRGDSGYDERTVAVSHPPGTHLVELTGRAASDPNIPEVLTVQSSPVGATPFVTARFLRNAGGDRGYLIYGLATPQAPEGLQLSNVAFVIPGETPTPQTNGIARLTDLHVITEDSFQARLRTVPVVLPNGARDFAADGDHALLKLNGGIDINGNGIVDHITPGTVTYGFEHFTDKASPLWHSGDGEFLQTIDTTQLEEGYHYLEAIAFRHRDDGGVPVFSTFRKVIYVDRLPPESAVASFDPIWPGQPQHRDLIVRSVDKTADNVHVFLNLPAGLSDEQVLAMVGQANNAGRIDRDLWAYGFFNLTHGNHAATVVTYEITGNVNVQRFGGLYAATANGAGLGDLNFNGTINAQDVTLFRNVLLSDNSQFNPAADIDGDGWIDLADAFLLGPVLQQAGVSDQTWAAFHEMRHDPFVTGGTYHVRGDHEVLAVSAGTTIVHEGNTLTATHIRGEALHIRDDAVVSLRPTSFGDTSGAGQLQTLQISPTGRLDIANNALVLDGESIEIVADHIRGGRLASAWADADSRLAIGLADNAHLGLSHFAGLEVSSSSVLVLPTLLGDANLDGFVNIGDLAILAANWQQSNRLWHQGDFNYDGLINIADLGMLAGNWQQDLSNWPVGLPHLLILDGAVVPEPAAALLGGAWLLVGRPRRVVHSDSHVPDGILYAAADRQAAKVEVRYA